MKNTQSLCLNYRFRQLYNRGKSQVAPNLVVYCSKNREKTGDNRLGLTVSTKVGKAVIRNAVRRKLREAYRLNEDRVLKGLDIVIVARTRASSAQYKHIEKDMLYCFKKLGILKAPPFKVVLGDVATFPGGKEIKDLVVSVLAEIGIPPRKGTIRPT